MRGTGDMTGEEVMNLIRLNTGPELVLAVTIQHHPDGVVEINSGGNLPLDLRAKALRLLADEIDRETGDADDEPVIVIAVSMSPVNLN